MTSAVEFKPNRALVELTNNVDEKIATRLKDAADSLGASLASEMKGRAPHRTGALAESIQWKTYSSKKGVTGVIGPNGGKDRYGYIVNAGAKAHEILAKNAKALAFSLPGVGQVFAKAVRSPGFEGRPFIAETFDANQQRIISELTEAAQGAIRDD